MTAPSAQPTATFAYVGCYTTKQRNARGEGIGVYRIDRASGDWTQVQLVRDLVNPSWLTFDRPKRFLYAAHGDGEIQRLMHERVMHVPIFEPATLHGVGPRVEEPGIGLNPLLYFTAPYEEMRLKKP